jgi:hypothetical protein
MTMTWEQDTADDMRLLRIMALRRIDRQEEQERKDGEDRDEWRTRVLRD